jgi:hypothetical protein
MTSSLIASCWTCFSIFLVRNGLLLFCLSKFKISRFPLLTFYFTLGLLQLSLVYPPPTPLKRGVCLHFQTFNFHIFTFISLVLRNLFLFLFLFLFLLLLRCRLQGKNRCKILRGKMADAVNENNYCCLASIDVLCIKHACNINEYC